MMKHLGITLLAGLSFLFSACEEEFDITIPDSVLNGIVFNGVITNENPPYFFLLRKPTLMSAEDDVYEGIEDAVMIVTDVTEGIRDTMQVVYPYSDYGGTFYDFYDYYQKKNTREMVHLRYPEESCRGMYVTTKIYGIEGHSYQLEIYYNGKHYESDVQKMEPALVITDIKLKYFDFNEKGKKWAPCISFTNPPKVDNYYLFQLHSYTRNSFTFSRPVSLMGGNTFWEYSILSDEYLEENVKDFLVDDGENPMGYPPGWDYPKFDSVYVWSQTISKSCYNVLDQMIQQFRTDGGAYTPAPTSVVGNISGGAFGCFRVSALSDKGIPIGER